MTRVRGMTPYYEQPTSIGTSVGKRGGCPYALWNGVEARGMGGGKQHITSNTKTTYNQTRIMYKTTVNSQPVLTLKP